MAEFRMEQLDPKEFETFGKYLGKPPTQSPTGTRDDLNVWLGISDLLGLKSESTVWTYLVVNRHDLRFDKLERHNQAAEAFIPLEGSSAIAVAPSSDPNDPDAVPDEDQIRAFLLDGSAGIFFPPGVWHWAPYAITETASFLLLLDKGVEDDIDIRDVGPHRLTLY